MKQKAKRDFETPRRLLIEERDVLTETINASAGSPEPPLDSHQVRPATGALSEQMKAVEAGVVQIRLERLEQINDALQRIDDGTWGLCSTCGKQIDERRLDADSAVLTCIECASAEGAGFRAPTL
jgi:RNA polymerase-binding transcription factor